MNVANIRLAEHRPRAGSTQATAVSPASGRASAAAPTSTPAASSTAIERSKSTLKPEAGVACDISYIGSDHGP